MYDSLSSSIKSIIFYSAWDGIASTETNGRTHDHWFFVVWYHQWAIDHITMYICIGDGMAFWVFDTLTRHTDLWRTCSSSTWNGSTLKYLPYSCAWIDCMISCIMIRVATLRIRQYWQSYYNWYFKVGPKPLCNQTILFCAYLWFCWCFVSACVMCLSYFCGQISTFSNNSVYSTIDSCNISFLLTLVCKFYNCCLIESSYHVIMFYFLAYVHSWTRCLTAVSYSCLSVLPEYYRVLTCPGLVQPPQRRQDPDSGPLWLLVRIPSVLGPELASRWAEYSLLWRMSLLYIFDILFFYHLKCLCNNFMASPLWFAVGPRSL